MEFPIELALQPAQTLVVSADITQNLRRKFTLRVKTLGFFLKVDALQVHRLDALDHFHIGFTRNPAKRLSGAAVGEDDPGIVPGDAGNQTNGVGQIGDFGRNSEGRVHLDRHGQFASGAVEDDAALGREIKAALRLVGGAAGEVAVAEDLEVDQAETDGDEPQAKKRREGVEPEFRAVRSGARHHLVPSSRFSVLSEKLASAD